jgi:hypothetical protein
MKNDQFETKIKYINDQFEIKIKYINEYAYSSDKSDQIFAMRDAAIFVHDTLGIAHSSARSLFGDDVPAHIAVAIYDRIVAKMPKAKGKL